MDSIYLTINSHYTATIREDHINKEWYEDNSIAGWFEKELMSGFHLVDGNFGRIVANGFGNDHPLTQFVKDMVMRIVDSPKYRHLFRNQTSSETNKWESENVFWWFGEEFEARKIAKRYKKVGNFMKVYRNQAFRDAYVVEADEKEYMIQYMMPNGAVFVNIIAQGAETGVDHPEWGHAIEKYKTRVPAKWKNSIVTAKMGTGWNRFESKIHKSTAEDVEIEWSEKLDDRTLAYAEFEVQAN